MKSKLPIAGLAIACAACCAPLLIPFLAGSGLMVGIAAVSLDALVCGAIAAGALGMAAYWLMARKRTKAQPDCRCGNSCAPAAGCGPSGNQMPSS